MRVLVTGGSGSIGGAVVEALVEQNVDVLALARSANSEDCIRAAGATPLAGDIRQPAQWASCLEDVDAVIHCACTWSDDMDAVDQDLTAVLIEGLQTDSASKALIYTGGCWFYGNTGDTVATEDTELQQTSGFASSHASMNNVLTNKQIRGMVIHPAMVYEHRGGVFEQMYKDIDELGYARVFGSMNTRWPLVHKADLAQLYALMLFHGKAGDVFNGSTIVGASLGSISQAISTSGGCYRKPVVCDIAQAMREFGDWASGFALDQQVCGRRAREVLGWQPEHTDVFEDILT